MITQLFKLIRKTLLTIVSSCLLLSYSGFAHGEPIGDIVENKGVTSVKRGDSRLETDVGTDINIYDEAETANGRMLIEFLDEEKLSLTENSLVYIDEAYYDPDPSLSKMSIRMVRGTSRFSSGVGNRIKKANVDVTTPTANITMRGTDFTTTIDELGRTMVILLPDEETGETSGEILVWNDGGETILNQAYAATTVASYEAAPTKSIVVQGITPNMIDNMFIVNPPSEIQQAVEESSAQSSDNGANILDFTEHDTDYLANDYLANDEFEFTELDMDLLNIDFLQDILVAIETVDILRRGTRSAQGTNEFTGTKLGFDPETQYNSIIDQGMGQLWFYREVNHITSVRVPIGSNTTLESTNEDKKSVITVGDGSSVIIIINQSG